MGEIEIHLIFPLFQPGNLFSEKFPNEIIFSSHLPHNLSSYYVLD